MMKGSVCVCEEGFNPMHMLPRTTVVLSGSTHI